MANLILGTPSEKQFQFLTATERYVAYGGARGGGKSWAVRVKSLLLALRYSGCRILILRRTLAELQENHIRPLISLTKDFANYNDSKKCFGFANGSTILCGYCMKEKDLLRYQGQEFDFIFIDEATQMEEQVFSALKGCLRGTNGFPKRMYLTCNPGGVGHGWVKRLFIDCRYRSGESPEEYRFIPAKLSDNKVLRENDPAYLKSLESLPNDLRRAWLDGCWDLFKGQYFEEFDREIHVVEPFEIPQDWKKYMAFDYGLDMLAALFFAVSHDGMVYVYRELHQPGLIVSEAAAMLREYIGEDRMEEIYLPPDMAGRQKDSGLSMAELFRKGGITGRIADNRRVPGWLAVKELLKLRLDPFGEHVPGVKIFKNCVNLIANLPALTRDGKNGSDASVHPHEITHVCDALRYFVLSYRPEERKKEEPLSYLEIAKRKALSSAKRGNKRKKF